MLAWILVQNPKAQRSMLKNWNTSWEALRGPSPPQTSRINDSMKLFESPSFRCINHCPAYQNKQRRRFLKLAFGMEHGKTEIAKRIALLFRLTHFRRWDLLVVSFPMFLSFSGLKFVIRRNFFTPSSSLCIAFVANGGLTTFWGTVLAAFEGCFWYGNFFSLFWWNSRRCDKALPG